MSSQQAAALAAFQDVRADAAQTGSTTNPADAGAEIAAIMQRPPAVDPTSLPLPLPQQPGTGDHSRVSSAGVASQHQFGGGSGGCGMQQLGGHGALGSHGNLQLLGSQGILQQQQQLGSHDDLVQLGNTRLGPIGSSSNLRQLGSHGNLQQLGSSGLDEAAGGRTSSLLGSHGNLQQLGSHSNLQQLGSHSNLQQLTSRSNLQQGSGLGSPAPMVGSSSNLAQLGSRGGALLVAGGSALALSASDIGPLGGSSGLLRAMGSTGNLATAGPAASHPPMGGLDGTQGRLPPHSMLQPSGHQPRQQGGHSTDGSHYSSHGSHGSSTAASGFQQPGQHYGPGSALLPLSQQPRPASGGCTAALQLTRPLCAFNQKRRPRGGGVWMYLLAPPPCCTLGGSTNLCAFHLQAARSTMMTASRGLGWTGTCCSAG